MPTYFFHLRGEIEGHDAVGHQCGDDREALAHGDFIAHRIGTEKPEMVKSGNCIAVIGHNGQELARVPLASSVIAPLNPHA
jgi:hypothetical protein